MTVISQVKQCFYSLKSVEENLHSLSLRTISEEARQDYMDVSKILNEVGADLQKRIGFLEWQEPQYKGF